MFQASCHCGDIEIKTQNPPKSLTSCNCSICRRIGAEWAYYERGEVEISEKKPSIGYSWGDRELIFHSCPSCGCTTHYTAMDGDDSSGMAINTRMAPAEVCSTIPMRHFDGADTWKFLD